ISLVNVNRGASRFESILGELGLMERLLSDFDKQKVLQVLESELDTVNCNLKLAELKQKSRKLLQEALQNEDVKDK
ncbi:MAG: hypothetical protein IBX55_18555, partial [Methyloprofundus sp.]|nr:hypothetical protein [Methyloprofundus sp.]